MGQIKENDSNSNLVNLRQKCEAFLDTLTLTQTEMKSLEKNTRDQRSSKTWVEERKLRVTSSYFGRICKARDVSSFTNVIKTIKEQKEINSPPVIHGIKYEAAARNEYLKNTNLEHQSPGLVIHNQYPFLAASPDGLIGNDGIIEIKCPFSAKDQDPSTYKFKFLNEKNTTLLHNHDYHYQIQGILEITNRTWCDLVIYTYKGIKIVRVYRNPTFWDVMLKKLRNFFYFHMLPEAVAPGNNFSPNEKKWTTSTPLKYLDNGLVADVYYYKELTNKRGYVVTVNTDVNFSLSEILIEDFRTLDDGLWLSGFVVDHCLCILNMTEEKYQIISVSKSSIIFDDVELHKNFVDNIKFFKKYVIMPVVRDSHFLLLVVDFENHKVTLIHPLGNEVSLKNIYMTKYLQFLSLKNISNRNWHYETVNHTRQKDDFNCGAYIIYFFPN